MLDYLQLPINHFFPHHPQITNPMTLQQLINKNTSVNGLPGGEAYVRISVSFSPACQTGAAARRARLKKSSIPGLQGPGPRAYHIYKSNVKMVSAQSRLVTGSFPSLDLVPIFHYVPVTQLSLAFDKTSIENSEISPFHFSKRFQAVTLSRQSVSF